MIRKEKTPGKKVEKVPHSFIKSYKGDRRKYTRMILFLFFIRIAIE